MSWENYNFSNEFQDTILACMVKFPKEFWSFGEIMRPQYFNGVDAAEVAFALRDYIEEFGKYPNFSTLMNFVYQKFDRSNPDKANQLVDYVMKLTELDTGDWEGVRKLMIKFAKERSLFAALRKIHAAQMEGKGNEVDAVAEVEQALIVGEDYRKLGVSLVDDYASVIDETTKKTYGVATGYNLFDDVWKCGWAPGWLIVPLAPPKSYKSTFCINLALNMAGSKVGKDIIYYACEIDEKLAMMRALYNISGVGSDRIFEYGVEKFKRAAKAGIASKITGNLWFKSFPSKTASIQDIEQHAKYLIQHNDLHPAAIIVDYAETVRPTMTGKNISDWRQQADIYIQARAMGTKLGCCVIMPDRCNRETVGRAVPNMASFQGSFEKAGAVDAAIGICFTEQERLQNRVRYFIFLNRHGPQLLEFEGKVDPELMRMSVDAQRVYIPEDETDSELGKKRGRKNRSQKLKESVDEAMESMT